MINCEIIEQLYQLTRPLKDGVTQKVMKEQHTMYDVDIHKHYFIEDEIQTLKELRNDLEELCDAIDDEIGLEYGKQLRKENKNERSIKKTIK